MDESKPQVLVSNFRELHGPANQLGIVLADDLSDMLSQLSSNTTGSFFAMTSRTGDDSDDIDNPLCSQKDPRNLVDVLGDMDELDDTLVLRIQAESLANGKAIFDRRITLPIDPEMRALLDKRLPQLSHRGEPGPWVRPGYVITPEEETAALRIDTHADGFRPPSCIECKSGEYSDAAMRLKIQGVVTLRMLLDRNGRALKILVLKGLPCGLSKSAIQAVEQWKLKPATMPDGQPVEVWQELEVTFQLY
jgi:TonB family protein